MFIMVLPALDEKTMELDLKGRPKLYLLPSPEQYIQEHTVSMQIRAIAYLVDIVIISIFTAISYALFFIAYKNVEIKLMLPGMRTHTHTEIDIVKQIISFIVFTSYMTISYWYMNGQTIGKKVWGLKVIATNNQKQELSFSQALVRSACYHISYLTCGIGFVLPYFRRDKKTLHDLLSQTIVITDKSVVSKVT